MLLLGIYGLGIGAILSFEKHGIHKDIHLLKIVLNINNLIKIFSHLVAMAMYHNTKTK